MALFAHTLETRDWVPQLAAALDAGLVMGLCRSCRLDGDAALIATKPVYGGSVWGEFAVRGTLRLATLRPGVFAPATPGDKPEVMQLTVEHIAANAVTIIDEVAAGASGGAFGGTLSRMQK